MNYTGIEQSKKLLELGLSPETADMCWGLDSDTGMYNNHPYPMPWREYTAKEFYIPCWSTGALLEVMPLIKEDINDGGCRPNLCKGWDNNKWHIVYRSDLYYSDWYDNSIDACYNTVVWLLENGYIKPTKSK